MAQRDLSSLLGERLIESDLAMRELGRSIGEVLIAGDLAILRGPLGAGKTTLTQGIASAFAITDVSSPTFVISRTHKSRSKDLPDFIHVDAYRLLGEKMSNFQFDDLDLDTQRDSSIVVMEWGADFALRLDESYLLIDIDFVDESSESRKVVISKK